MHVGRQLAGLVVFVVLCFAAAALGGLATYPQIATWYAGLVKPAWTPPSAIFGPVWSALYLGMAIAAWLVWRRDAIAGARGALMLFAIQLVLNAAWSWLFFGLRSPGWAFAEVLLLWAAIAATGVAFWRHSRVAGLLFVPYLAWVSFASVLNWAIWRLNA